MSESYPIWRAKSWENGEFTLGFKPPRPKPAGSEGETARYMQQEDYENLTNCIRAHGAEATIAYLEQHPESYPSWKPLPPLESTTVPKSHRVKKARGQSGISTYGKRLAKNAVLRLEREAGRECLSFLTLTIPGVGKEGGLHLVRNWAEIVRVFQQKLKRSLQRHGLSGEMVGVTEIQEKRFAATGVVALHLHIVFQGRQRYKGWALKPGDARSMWRSVLEPHLQQFSSELYWDAVENLVPVKYSASAYLGKYLSKGIKACSAIRAENPEIEFPNCWYLCTNSLRRKVKQQMMLITPEKLPYLASWCREEGMNDVFVYVHPVVYKNEQGEDVEIGFVGKFTARFNAVLRGQTARLSSGF